MSIKIENHSWVLKYMWPVVSHLKYWLVVVDVAQLDDNKRVGNMILVVVVVFPLVIHLNSESEALTLQLVLVIQRLNNLQGPCSVVVPHHSELVCTETARVDHFVVELVGFILVMHSDGELI